jgi:uncharacterized metal-binding protein YceD (DUF177 family)
MHQKKLLKQFIEFDAWSFTRSGGFFSSKQLKFEFPRLAEDENIAHFNIEHWEISGRINARSESVISFKGCFFAEFPCVVCGSSIGCTINFERHLILMTSDTKADSYDESVLDGQTDVVACQGTINLRDWLEDEILLACPMFPKHEGCVDLDARSWREFDDLEEMNAQEEGIVNQQNDTDIELSKEVQRPFAKLSTLLKTGKKK